MVPPRKVPAQYTCRAAAVAQLNSVTLTMPPLLSLLRAEICEPAGTWITSTQLGEVSVTRGGGWIVEHIILPLCCRALINWPAQPHYLHRQVFRTCLRAISLALQAHMLRTRSAISVSADFVANPIPSPRPKGKAHRVLEPAATRSPRHARNAAAGPWRTRTRGRRSLRP